jgi:hypothetical protein
MRKTKAFKKNKYSKKTRKNRKTCEKGITDEVIRIRKLIVQTNKYIKKNHKNV